MKFTSAKTQLSRAFFAFLVIDYICSFAGTAVTISGDRGTENSNIPVLQTFFSGNSRGFYIWVNQVNRLRTMNPPSA